MNDAFFEELAQEFFGFAGVEQNLLGSAVSHSHLPSHAQVELMQLQNRNVIELFAKVGYICAKHSVGLPASSPIVMRDIAAVTDDDAQTKPESRPLTRHGMFGKLFGLTPKDGRDPEKCPPVREQGKFYVRYKNSLGEDVYQIFSSESQARSYAKVRDGVWGQL